MQARTRKPAARSTIELWQPRAVRRCGRAMTFTVTAGCDKHLATCRAKFANTVNFRGFPHMPGNDFVLAATLGREPMAVS